MLEPLFRDTWVARLESLNPTTAASLRPIEGTDEK